MSITAYDPELWLETVIRGIKDYIEANIDTAVYDVVMEFPGPTLDASEVPLRKALIHFEVDDIQTHEVGFSEKAMEDNFDDPGGGATTTTNPQWASIVLINFDVGVWTSDACGGTTQRMRAIRTLHQFLAPPHAIELLRTATDGGDGGIEILKFQGGNFIEDTINDVRVYRSINGGLDVKVFSRTPISVTPTTAIDTIVQDPNLSV